MIEWGIYTEETQEQFLFLSPGPKCNGKIISSLQAFETSLLMVGLGRWTSAVVCLCNAIEIITKIEFPNEAKFEKQIDAFIQKFELENIEEMARTSRQMRNKFIHEAVIPTDNSEAISVFFNSALTVYKMFLERSAGINLYDVIYAGNLSRNLQVARNLAKKSSAPHHIGYKMAVIVKTVANHSSRLFTPVSQSESADDLSSDWKNWDRYIERQHRYEDSCESDVIHPQNEPAYAISCPADCGGSLSIAMSEDLKSETFASAMCCECGLLILEKDLIKVYVKSTLGENKIAALLKSYGV